MNERTRILVVDDDEGIRKVLATVLRSEGYIVDTASNGKEAIRKSNSNFYNVALIDVRLPDMKGTELLVKMRKTTPKMVRIIITGFPSLQNAVEAVNEGADSYILKPFDMDNILTKIKEHLKKQREARKYSEEKVKEFIETRVKELEKETTIQRKPR